MNDDERSAPNFAGIEGADFDGARVVILPVPFEGTVSYGKGAGRGPMEILHASTQVELHDEEAGDDLTSVGVVTDDFLQVSGRAPQDVVDATARRFGELLDAGKWIVMLGGEHTITTGGVRAAAERYEALQVVQLDAHADLRDSYQGTPWSHACAMARVLEYAPVLGVGIRSYSAGEAARMREGIPGHRLHHAWEIGREGWIDKVLDGVDGRPVYLTIDLDFFDPGMMPATGTPEPGGGQWWPTMEFLAALFRRADVVAADVVELAPVQGLHHPQFTAARLVCKLIAYRFLTPRTFND